MSEVQSLRLEVSALRGEIEALRGMVHALATTTQIIVEQEPLAVAERTARGISAMQKRRPWAGHQYRLGFDIVARRMGRFGKALHARASAEIADQAPQNKARATPP